MANYREEHHGLGADGFPRSALGERPLPSVPVRVPGILDGSIFHVIYAVYARG